MMEPPAVPGPELREADDERLSTQGGAAGDDADDVASSFGGSAAGGRGRGRARGPRPAGEAPAQKRPRYNDTAFADLTITDLENACREVTSLKRQVAQKDEELASLKELRAEKAALAKQVKALEGNVEKTEKVAGKLQDQVHEKKQDENAKLDRIKRAVKQAFNHQMVFHSAFKDQLAGAGREVVAFIPNVSPEQVKALGCDVSVARKKFSDAFFGEYIRKTSNGVKLIVSRTVTFKYVKAACELRAEAMYTVDKGKPDKPEAPTPKKAAARGRGGGRGRGRKAAAGSAGTEGDAGAEGEAGEDEGEDAADDADGDEDAADEGEVPEAAEAAEPASSPPAPVSLD